MKKYLIALFALVLTIAFIMGWNSEQPAIANEAPLNQEQANVQLIQDYYAAYGAWTLGGIYEHGLIQTPQGWKVNRMKMT